MTDRDVVPLPGVPPEIPEPPVTPPGRLHAIAMACMAASGILGLVSALLFVTVTWSGAPRRAVIAVLLFSILGFLAGGSAAVLTAARDTYARTPRPRA